MTWRMWMAVLSLAGIFIAAYLTLYHFGYIGTLVCTNEHGCETVQTSKYAKLIGLLCSPVQFGHHARDFHSEHLHPLMAGCGGNGRNRQKNRNQLLPAAHQEV